MREIKFKAVHYKSKKWVYGMLYFSAGQSGLQIVETIECQPSMQDPCGDTINEYYNIIPETVCQFIGLKDKNSVDIYENDIDTDEFTFEVNVESGGIYRTKNSESQQWHAQCVSKGCLPFTIAKNAHDGYLSEA